MRPRCRSAALMTSLMTALMAALMTALMTDDRPDDRPDCLWWLQMHEEGLSLPEFLQTMVMCAFQRSNTDRLDLMKKSAPRLVTVEHALHHFLNANVLPLAKSRNLLEAHKTFQEDEELQRVLGENSEELFRFFASKPTESYMEDEEAPGMAPGAVAGGEADGIEIVPFVKAMEDCMLVGSNVELKLRVWETTATPVQPGEFGNYVTKGFTSSFSVVDAKQVIASGWPLMASESLTDGLRVPLMTD